MRLVDDHDHDYNHHHDDLTLLLFCYFLSFFSSDASPARLLLFSARDVDRPGPTEWTLDADDDDNDNDHDLADDDPIPESALPPGGVDVVVANILKNPLVQAREKKKRENRHERECRFP